VILYALEIKMNCSCELNFHTLIFKLAVAMSVDNFKLVAVMAPCYYRLTLLPCPVFTSCVNSAIKFSNSTEVAFVDEQGLACRA